MEGPNRAHQPLSQPENAGFLWIEDDGLLRDEGVVFGLVSDGAGLREKQECIQAYYRKCAAETERRREGLRQDLMMIEAEITASSRDTRDLRTSSGESEPTNGSGSPGGLAIRYAVGIVLAMVACGASGVIVYEHLQHAFERPGIVTTGVLAAGLFTAFLPVSLLFLNDRSTREGDVELWKVRLAEFGLPLVSAAFIAVWAWELLGAGRALSSFAFFFLVFTFVGRLLLSSIPRFGEAVGSLRRERRRQRDATLALERDAQARSSLSALTERIGLLHREMAALRSSEEWEAICAAKLALFRSEFELAVASRISTSQGQSHQSAPSTFGSL